MPHLIAFCAIGWGGDATPITPVRFRVNLKTFHPDPVGMLRMRIFHARLEGRDVRSLLGHRGRAAEGTRIEAIGHLAGVAPERVSGGKAATHHVLIRGTFYHASRNHFLHSASVPPGENSNWQARENEVDVVLGASG